MIIVKRDTNTLKCRVVKEVSTWRELTAYLIEVKEVYDKEGWSTCWDNDEFKSGLILWRDKECLYFGPYFRRVPKDRNKEFMWMKRRYESVSSY